MAEITMSRSKVTHFVGQHYHTVIVCLIVPLIAAGGHALTECVCNGHPSIVCHCQDHQFACCHKQSESPASGCHAGLHGHPCNKHVVYLTLPTVVTEVRDNTQALDALVLVSDFDVSPFSSPINSGVFVRDLGPPPDNVLAMHCRLNI